MWLLNSHVGIYIVQTVLHSLIAAIIIERALQVWRISNPLHQFRYRILALVLPLSLSPVYALISPRRNSFLFREQEALFNINRWFSLEIWDVIPFSLLFLILIAATSVLFFLQEIIPIIRDYLNRGKASEASFSSPEQSLDAVLSELSTKLDISKPPLYLVDDDAPHIVTSGAKTHSIIVSTGLVRLLDKDQIASAIAHELAHIVRRSNATTWIIFLIRVAMFFNPIALIVFRRIVQDDEHICDDITVSLTGNPQALASTLKVFYASYHEPHGDILGRLATAQERIENYSHNLLLKERINRIEAAVPASHEPFGTGKFLLTICVIVIMNYFIV